MGDSTDSIKKIGKEAILNSIQVLEKNGFRGALEQDDIKEAAKEQIRKLDLGEPKEVMKVMKAAGILEACKRGEVKNILKGLLPEDVSLRPLDDPGKLQEIREVLQNSAQQALGRAISSGGSASSGRSSSPQRGR